MEPTLDGSVYKLMHRNARSGRIMYCRTLSGCLFVDHFLLVPVEPCSMWDPGAEFVMRQNNESVVEVECLNERKSERQTRTPFRIPAVSDNLRGGDVIEPDDLPF